MPETSTTILAKNVDGGVEDIVIDLLARIEALEARPQTFPDGYTMSYPDGVVVKYARTDSGST